MSLYDRDWYREAYKEKEQKYGKDFRYKPKNRITTHLPKQAWRYIIGIPLIVLSLGGFFYTKSPNLQTIQLNQTINDSAIGFGYKLTHLYFCASQDSNVENTIKDFLTTENIDYTKLTYDSEQQTYFVAL